MAIYQIVRDVAALGKGVKDLAFSVLDGLQFMLLTTITGMYIILILSLSTLHPAFALVALPASALYLWLVWKIGEKI